MSDKAVADRMQRRQRRLDKLRGITAAQNVRIRVIPRDEELRQTMKHPRGGGFRSQGSVEWPLDQFTKRRLREGSVSHEKATPEPEEKKPAARRLLGEKE
jgi:hypothetical protein